MTILQVRTEFTGVQGTPYLNTLYFDAAGGTPQQAVDAVGTYWGDVDAQMTNEISWATDSEVEEINEATGTIVDIHGTTPASGGGALTDDILPPSSQALVAWTTSTFIGGRRLRGRSFIPGVTEANSVDGILASVAFIAFSNAADALVADTSSTLVVWHRPVSGAGGQFGAVTSASQRQQFAVLRSRRD